MNFSHLESLVAIDDHGTFRAAAAALHVTQPALSRRIAALEHELGSTLFEPIGRGNRLTEAGRVAVESARRVLHERRQLVSSVDEVAGLASGTLRITGLPSLVITHLVDLIAMFQRSHPAIELVVNGAADSAGLLKSVASAESDIGIVDLPITWPRLRSVSLGEQQLMAVFPPGTQLSIRSPDTRPVVTREQLRAMTLISLPAETSSGQLVDQWLADSRGAPTSVVTTNLRDLLVPLVLAGVGVALVPDQVAVSAEARGAVIAHVRPQVRREVGLVVREGQPSSAVSRFLQLASTRPGGRNGDHHAPPNHWGSPLDQGASA